MAHRTQDDLEWVEGTFGLEPHWTKEPDTRVISELALKHLNLSNNASVDVAFYSKSAFTKTYKITTVDASYLLRVSLPIDPHRKTESAVATIMFIRQNTTVPAPHIIAYSSDNSNELGFEWMLMKDTPGTPLYKVWRKMSWDSKETLVRQLAEYQLGMFAHNFQKIGNLYAQAEGFVIDQMVTTIYYQGDHVTKNVIRGPFTSSHK